MDRSRVIAGAIVILLAVAVLAVPVAAEEYVFVTKWGEYGTGEGFKDPFDIAIDTAGHIYITETDANHILQRILKLDSSMNFITKWGSYGTGNGQFNGPQGIAVNAAGNVYVADTYNHRIQKFDSSGNLLTKWGSWGSGDGQFSYPDSVAVDAAGNVYVSDTNNGRIQKFDSDGTFLGKWGSWGSGDGQLRFSQDLVVDAAGNIYVAEYGNHRIQKFDSNGNFLWKKGSSGSGDGQFLSPYGITVDAAGNVYVADTWNHRIQKFDSSGNFLTKWGSRGSGNGQFSEPFGVAVDSAGNVYVTERGNDRVQMFAPASALTVTGIVPASGLNTGSVSITDLSGTGFANGATVNLTRTGETNIVATDVSVLSSTQITCTLDLTGAVAGSWNVVVTNPDNQFATLTDGFTVNAENRAPVAEDDTYTTDEDTLLTISAPGVLANDNDPDGDALTAVLVDDVSNGTLTLNADGSFTYLPNTGFSDIDTFTYTANDGTQSSNVATVSINVNPASAVLTSIVVTPVQPILEIGGTQQFTATGYDQYGTPLPTGEIVWSSTNTTVGTIDATGLFTATAEGSTTVTATAGEVSGTAEVTVNPALTVTGIVPASGPNTGNVSITNLSGTGFVDGATVNLTRTGETNIVATDVSVLSSTQITCTLDLTGAAAGSWNVVVTNPDGRYDILSDGFAVVAASEIVTFNDPNLEATVRGALGKPVGDITADDMATFITLGADWRGIRDLSGLEYAVNLQHLYLQQNRQISDLGPLAGLTDLQTLDLWNNQISDLSPLAGLTNLSVLLLGSNQISDIGPLAGLTDLQRLHLYDNQIRDIGPLAGLTNLWELRLYNNQIRDIGPLVANSGLGSGDEVYLQYNYLDLTPGSADMNDIQTLQSRGVYVAYEPQNPVPTYTLDLAVNPEGGGTVTGAGTYKAGDTVPITATPNEGWEFVNWTNETGATVSSEPNFDYPMPEGDVALTANFEGEAITYTLGLAVNPAGSGTVTGAGTYAAGDTVSVTATPNDGYTFVNWTDETDVTVSTAASFDYTMPDGDVTLTANFAAITYTLDLAVNPEGSGTATGAGTYAAGATVPITATPNEGWEFANWTDGTGATVSSEATFDYTMPAQETALTANFEPAPPVLARIEVSPAEATLEVGATRQFTATGYDQYGNPLSVGEIVWSSTNEAVGTIDASGMFTALAAGSTELVAEANGISGKANVTVTPAAPVLTSIAVTPESPALEIGTTQQFTATCYDQYGQTMPDMAVSWSSSNTSVGTIESNGMFTALTAGSTTVTASAAGVSGQTVATVNPAAPVVTRIAVSPPSVTLDIGDTQAFVATCYDQYENEMPGTSVSWASDSTTVGTIDATGLFTATAEGSTTVTATAGDVSGTAEVRVNPALTVTGIVPASGPNTGPVSITDLSGTGFADGATVKLTRDGEADIVATDVAVLSPTQITCTLDLTGAAVGTWNVVVTNPDEQYDILSDGFAVVAASEVVTFNDPNLEAAVRQELSKPKGDITADDMATLTRLSAAGRGIRDLSGLEYAVNLQTLYISNNQISDLSPLAGLTNLQTLWLQDNQVSDLSPLAGLTNLQRLWLNQNQIRDVSPLAGLTNLRELLLAVNQISDLSPLAGLTNLGYVQLYRNQISDLSPLASLTNLYFLDISYNQISDISPLAGLTRLSRLSLDNNQISDISPLAGLINLYVLNLNYNQIRDISPLVANSGLAGDDVYLQYNYLDLTPGSAAMNDIQTLQSRGVYVVYEPQHEVTKYTLDLAVNPEGSGTVTGAGTYAAGYTVSITATPNEGWEFANWTDGTGATVSSEATFDYPMPARDTALIANFEPAPPVLTRIDVSPVEAALEVGETRQFTATGYDQYGNTIPTGEIVWSSTNEAVGTIDASGMFTALAAGSTELVAEANGISGKANVTVTPAAPVLTSIAVTPESPALEVGTTQQFTATCYDQYGQTMPEVTVSWSSSNTSVGTIESNGMFTALTAGSTTVTASAAGISGQTVATVNPAAPAVTRIAVSPLSVTLDIGDTQAFVATCYDQYENEMPGTSVSWASDSTTVGTIDATGLFTATAEGSATVTATAGDISGTAEVAVNPAPPVLTSISVSPAAPTIDAGDTQQFTATCYDQYGQTMPEVTVSWSSSNISVGTIESNGMFTALTAGSTTVTASAEGISGQAVATVNLAAPVITRIAVSPPSVTLDIGDMQTFVATCYDQYENEMPGTDVSWSSDDTTVGTIDATGLFTATAEGSATVTATAGEVSGTAEVTVNPAPPVLTSISVSPAAPTIDVGETQQFTAICYDQYGAPISDVSVIWSSENETVGTIDTSGLFTAIEEGATTITASANGISGTATVTVTPAPRVLTTVDVSPATADIAVGETEQFTATCYDQNGEVMPDVSVTWSSSNEAVGTMTAGGIFTAHSEGATTVTASAEGVSGSASVTVRRVNTAPIAVDDAFTTNIRTQLTVPAPGVLENDTDSDGDVLTAALVSKPSNGVLTLNTDGSFTYIPKGNFIGTDTFTYKANDGSLNSSVATVTITVLATNHAPIAADDTVTMTQDTTYAAPAPGVLENDQDPDGDTVTAKLVSKVTYGSLKLKKDGSFTYIPKPGFTGEDSFTYQTSDGKLSSDIATVRITVEPTAVIPPVADFSASPLGGKAPVFVQFTDTSTGTINSWTWTFGDGGTSTEQNPQYKYTRPGTYTVSLTVTGPGGSDTKTVTDYIQVTGKKA